MTFILKKESSSFYINLVELFWIVFFKCLLIEILSNGYLLINIPFIKIFSGILAYFKLFSYIFIDLLILANILYFLILF